MEKIDARKLSAAGRAMLRKMVIRLRKQSKMPAKELAAVAGVHVRTVEDWLLRARRKGEESLAGEKKRGRPVSACRKLTMMDEMWLRDQIVGHTPEQLKLPFALWTRPAVKTLIKERFGLEMPDRLVGKYLKRSRLHPPQRPLKRALEQDPIAVKTWLEQTWPQLLARARREGARVLWGDETAVKEDANWVRGYAPRGKTPVLRTPTRRDRLSMISAISARGFRRFPCVGSCPSKSSRVASTPNDSSSSSNGWCKTHDKRSFLSSTTCVCITPSGSARGCPTRRTESNSSSCRPTHRSPTRMSI